MPGTFIYAMVQPSVYTSFENGMIRFTLISLILLFSTATPVLAADNPEFAAIRSRLAQLVPNQQPDAINETGLPGLYQIRFGTQVVYMSQDARFLIQGSVVDLEKRQDLTEVASNQVRKEIMDDYDPKKLIVYAPENGKPKHVITVFTDIDCPYCAKLHSEMDQYLAVGIEVRYMMFPRAGLGSDSFKKAVSAWCADDQEKALTLAKNRQPIPVKTCKNPVAEQYSLGQNIGVTGTPAIVLEDGSLQPGYVPAAQLARLLESK